MAIGPRTRSTSRVAFWWWVLWAWGSPEAKTGRGGCVRCSSCADCRLQWISTNQKMGQEWTRKKKTVQRSRIFELFFGAMIGFSIFPFKHLSKRLKASRKPCGIDNTPLNYKSPVGFLILPPSPEQHPGSWWPPPPSPIAPPALFTEQPLTSHHPSQPDLTSGTIHGPSVPPHQTSDRTFPYLDQLGISPTFVTY